MAKRKPQLKTAAPVEAKPVAGLWIYLLLLAAVLAPYLQLLHFDFVTYDDPDYVTANSHVQAGLTLAGVKWALTSSFAGNWFPVTWLSHMLDCQIFGLDAGWHHCTNLAIHAAATLLWFALLYRITGARWRSALVAFVFALHPLHVESVAWVAERKDVLSGMLWVLTLSAYAAHCERPGKGRYLAMLALFTLGLMAKPMLVTLPLVLILLDQWPLRRGLRLLEKVPLLALAAAVSVVTYVVHQSAGAAPTFQVIPLGVRVENALLSYAVYLVKMIWPANLAVFYPYPSRWESLAAPAAISGVALAGVTIVALRVFRTRPHVTISWLWYLITLVPVIGLVQVGAQARADRYTYIPMIGIAIAMVWTVAEITERWPRAQVVVAALVCSACLVLTWVQVGYWRDSATLYRHAIDVTDENYVARYNLASVLEDRGETADAISQLRETVRIRPGFAIAHSVLGQLLGKQGQPVEAVAELQRAVALSPASADAHVRLGEVLGSLGRTGEAAHEFAETIRLQPDHPDAHYNLGLALAQMGRFEDAVRELRAAVQLRPDDAEARLKLGTALEQVGRVDESIAQVTEALRIKPDFGDARQLLDELMARKR